MNLGRKMHWKIIVLSVMQTFVLSSASAADLAAYGGSGEMSFSFEVERNLDSELRVVGGDNKDIRITGGTCDLDGETIKLTGGQDNASKPFKASITGELYATLSCKGVTVESTAGIMSGQWQVYTADTGDNWEPDYAAFGSWSISACKATVPDNVDFGKITHGAVADLSLETTVDDGAVISFTSDNLDDDGRLSLGKDGNTNVTVQPSDGDAIGKGKWTTTASRPSIPLHLVVDSSVSPGDYSASMTATLTCN